MEKTLLKIGDIVAHYSNGKHWSNEEIVHVTPKQAHSDARKFWREVSEDGQVKSIFYQGTDKYVFVGKEAAEELEERDAMTNRILHLVEELEMTGFETVRTEELEDLVDRLFTYTKRPHR